MNYDFVAVDIETANIEFWSLCQIGLAFFKNGQIIDTYSSLVNPQTWFDPFNVSIHGITSQMVTNAPKLKEIYLLLNEKLDGEIAVHHTHFDRTAFAQLSAKIHQKPIHCEWFDSSRLARRTWDEVKYGGYGLCDLSRFLGIDHIKPHDALEDAITTGKITLAAIEKSGISFNQWVENSRHNFKLFGASDQELQKVFNAEPNKDGPLFGEVVVFTGALSITRLEASRLAYSLGCDIDSGVTKKTTVLVVGDQDLRQLAGYEKSSKHRKAEDLIRTGQPLRIVGEQDFFAMVGR
jgi:DNA polymerase-3 subunit epsilon